MINEPIVVLYQAIQAPVIDGVRKPMKPGGYSDSGADIAYTQLVASFLNFILYFSHSIFKFLWVNPWRVSNV